MRPIGEILLAHGWVEPSILRRALLKSREGGQRLCSYLIAHGALEFDDASRALGEQHGVHAALRKHLELRQQALASVIPAALARACIALPLGHMGGGELILCVRDPSPALRTQLERAVGEPIVLAVAPAEPLEALVSETYGEEDANEFDIDLNTGQIPPVSAELGPDDSLEMLNSLELVELDERSSQTALGGGGDPLNPPTHRGGVDPLNPPTHRRQRSGLDAAGDAPVSRMASRSGLDAAGRVEAGRKPNRSGLYAAGDVLPSRPQTPSGLHAALERAASAERATGARELTREPVPVARETLEALAAGSVVPSARPPESAQAQDLSLDFDDEEAAELPAHAPPPGLAVPDAVASPVRPAGATLDTSSIDAATTSEGATDAAISLATQRWTSGLLFEIESGTATGQRGFGAKLSDETAQWMVLPLATSSIVATAAGHAEAVAVDPGDAGELQKRLLSLIGENARAIAIVIRGAPRFVLVVGEPHDDTDDATLKQLARALERAHARTAGG